MTEPRARAGDTPAGIDPPGWRAKVSGSASGFRSQLVEAARKSDPWKQRPESLAEQWAYVRRGDWMPGDKHKLLERAGLVYGAFGLALSAVAYFVAWVGKRPMRLTLTAVAASVFYVSWWVV